MYDCLGKGGKNTVIYLDVLIAENALMDYCLLAATAKLGGFSVKRYRMFAAALCGGIYAGVAVLWPQSIFPSLPIWVGFCILLILIAFGKQQLFRRAGLFFLVSSMVAGLTMLLAQLGGETVWHKGVYRLDVSLRAVLLAGAIGWVVSGLMLAGNAKHGILQKDTGQFRISFFGTTAEVTVLFDTGNELRDQIGGHPILVLERDAAKRCLPHELEKFCDELTSSNAPAQMLKLPSGIRNRFRLIPFSSVGNDHGLMVAFRPDEIYHEGSKINALIAITPHRITNGRYEGLIGIGKE